MFLPLGSGKYHPRPSLAGLRPRLTHPSHPPRPNLPFLLRPDPLLIRPIDNYDWVPHPFRVLGGMGGNLHTIKGPEQQASLDQAANASIEIGKNLSRCQIPFPLQPKLPAFVLP